MDVLIFDVAGQRYALPVAGVREVLPFAALARLPEAPSCLAGILRLRGTLLPVVELRRRLGLPDVAPRVSHRIVVVSVGHFAAGLWVDSVDGVASMGTSGNEARPTSAGGLVHDVIDADGHMLTLLDAQSAVGADVCALFPALQARDVSTLGALSAANPANGGSR